MRRWRCGVVGVAPSCAFGYGSGITLWLGTGWHTSHLSCDMRIPCAAKPLSARATPPRHHSTWHGLPARGVCKARHLSAPASAEQDRPCLSLFFPARMLLLSWSGKRLVRIAASNRPAAWKSLILTLSLTPGAAVINQVIGSVVLPVRP